MRRSPATKSCGRSSPPVFRWLDLALGFEEVADRAIENNGKPNFPLIPAGFLLLAAALGGKNVEEGEQLHPTDADGTDKAWNTFPQIALPSIIRYRLDKSAKESGKAGEEAILATRKLLSWEHGFAADLCVWLLKIKELCADTPPLCASSDTPDEVPWSATDDVITFYFCGAVNGGELRIVNKDLLQTRKGSQDSVEVGSRTKAYISQLFGNVVPRR